MPRDSRAMTDLVEDFDPLTIEQISAMQRIVAGNAKGRGRKAQVADAIELMMMLGVHPCQSDEWRHMSRMNTVHPAEMKVHQ
jgi:hypothetical protein